jgi:hypothetical protein
LPSGWAREEVEATVADYFAMLEQELRGLEYRKTDHRRRLLPYLNDRSEQSIEFKHANISAILIELGFPYISGYKPRSNYQQLLRDVVEDRLAATPGIVQLAAEDADRSVPIPSLDDLLNALTAAPKPTSQAGERPARRPYRHRPNPLQVNYLEREARNRSLGLAGEEFVLAFERARLLAGRQDRLANKVEHVARTKGDGLGFDILSYELSGAERFVEVKTTKYGAETPFFLSRSEVEVSGQSPDQYHLYRVFDFRAHRRLFTLNGSLKRTCALDPYTYLGRVA